MLAPSRISRTGAVMTPIYASSTFAQSSPGVHTGWEYARTGNPTRAAFEQAVAELEGGVAGFAFASGMAAEATLLDLLDQGSHVVAGDDLYGGTWRLFERVRKRSAGLSVTYVDPTDQDAFTAAVTPKTRMIWVELPTNPLLLYSATRCQARFSWTQLCSPYCKGPSAIPLFGRGHSFVPALHKAGAATRR